MSTLSEKANRILTLIPLVRRRPGISVAELARRLGVSPRTILSDLDTALMCGVPPYLPNDYIGVYVEKGQVRIDFADHFKRPITLTPAEALSLRLALEALPRRSGEHVQALRKKLEALLAARLGAAVEHRFALPAQPDALQCRIADIERAVVEHREIRIEYYTASRDAMTERTVRPYAIVEHQGHWYLVGHCRLRDRELPFRIDRVKSVALTDRRFEVPASFDIERYRRPEMYFPPPGDLQVAVRFRSREALRRAANAWDRASVFSGMPARRDVREKADGSVTVTLSVGRPEWIVFWALQHADEAEILRPAALRRRVVTVCDALLSLYG